MKKIRSKDGLNKVPQESIDYFKENLDQIFATGNFAEGDWNKKLGEHVKKMTNASKSIPTNSNGAGLVALMSIYREMFERKNVLIQSNTMYG